jgi:molybdate transport system permease protein
MSSPASGYGRNFERLLAVPLAAYLTLVLLLLLSLFVALTGEAFTEAFTEPAVWHAVGLSIFSTVVSTTLAMLVAIPSGYVLSRRRFPGMFLLDTILDLPIVLPPLVLGLCILLFFSSAPGRLIDEHLVEFVYTWRGIVLVQFTVGCAFAVRVIKAGFDGFDRRYEEVAQTLGANRWQTFVKVVLPMIGPSLVAGVVITWARVFGLFGPVLLVAGTMRKRTEIMPTTIFLEVSIGRLEVALVIGALMVLISVTTLVVFKWLGGKGYLW